MGRLRFAWDPRKASSNLRKHGATFEEGQTVFADDNALLLDDPGHSQLEDRSVMLGLSARMRIPVVSHTLRDGRHTIRVISARRATKREPEQYFEQVMP